MDCLGAACNVLASLYRPNELPLLPGHYGSRKKQTNGQLKFFHIESTDIHGGRDKERCRKRELPAVGSHDEVSMDAMPFKLSLTFR